MQAQEQTEESNPQDRRAKQAQGDDQVGKRSEQAGEHERRATPKLARNRRCRGRSQDKASAAQGKGESNDSRSQV